MIIECTSCHARYQYDEERFERKPSKKIKCAKCATVFDIENPAFAVRPSASANDSTAARREETQARRPESEEKTAQAQVPEGQRSTGPVVSSPHLPKGRRLSIAIIAGNDAGTVFRVEKPRMTIGRSGADITINDSEASRQHAAVEVRDSVVLVEDLKSTNGTLIDGVKVTEPAELQDKSEFQIGGTTLMLIVTDDG